MSKQQSSHHAAMGPEKLDQKAIFDAGYMAYEDQFIKGFGDHKKKHLDENSHHAMWRIGWQRAHEASSISRFGKFE